MSAMNRSRLEGLAEWNRKMADETEAFANRLGEKHETHMELLRDAAQYRNTAQQIETILAEADGEQEPVAWLHTLCMELDQFSRLLTFCEENPFGEPGEDYSEEYSVTSEPLYQHPAPQARAEVTDDILLAWQDVATLSGSALLAGEKCKNDDKYALYKVACHALCLLGNVYYELTGEGATHDKADAIAAKAGGG